MRDECDAKGRADLWRVFECRVLGFMTGQAPVPYEQLVGECRLASPSRAANLLVTAKRMFTRILREVIGDTVGSEEEADEEIRELKAALSRGT
jgi:hypothetical protein